LKKDVVLIAIFEATTYEARLTSKGIRLITRLSVRAARQSHSRVSYWSEMACLEA